MSNFSKEKTPKHLVYLKKTKLHQQSISCLCKNLHVRRCVTIFPHEVLLYLHWWLISVTLMATFDFLFQNIERRRWGLTGSKMNAAWVLETTIRGGAPNCYLLFNKKIRSFGTIRQWGFKNFGHEPLWPGTSLHTEPTSHPVWFSLRDTFFQRRTEGGPPSLSRTRCSWRRSGRGVSRSWRCTGCCVRSPPTASSSPSPCSSPTRASTNAPSTSRTIY